MTQKLTDKKRQQVADHYLFSGKRQQDTADAFGISRRTVQRILLEKGMIAPTDRVSKQKAEILQIVNDHGLDADSLHRALNMTPMTPGNVQQHLVNLPTDQLLNLFYNITRQQVVRDIRRSAQAQQQAEATARQTDGSMQQEALV